MEQELLKRQKEFMKVLCTFRQSREKVPLVETLALAEEQNIDVSIFVVCLGMCSSSHYLCFVNTMQLFSIGKQVTLGVLGDVDTYFLLAVFIFSP